MQWYTMHDAAMEAAWHQTTHMYFIPLYIFQHTFSKKQTQLQDIAPLIPEATPGALQEVEGQHMLLQKQCQAAFDRAHPCCPLPGGNMQEDTHFRK